jgi:hypothetical protein
VALPTVHREPPQQGQEVAHLIRESERRSGALTARISRWALRLATTGFGLLARSFSLGCAWQTELGYGFTARLRRAGNGTAVRLRHSS